MTTFAPSGFSLAKRPPSHNEYYVPASDSNTYAVGDPIATDGSFFVGRLPDSRVVQGMPHATAAVSGGRIRGVVVGVVPGPGGAEGSVVPAIKSRPYVLLVDDSPLTTFSIQADNTLPITAGGMYANFTVSAPQGSVSGFRLDGTSLNTSTGDLLIQRIEENTGANSRALVTFVLREDAQIQSPASQDWNLRVTNPSGLTRWRVAFAAAMAEYGVTRLHCLGDSVPLGTYSNDTGIPTDDIADAQGFVGRLRTMLARRCNATPAGYIAANDKRNTLSGTGAVTSSIGPIINTVRTDNVTSLGGALPLPAGATISIPVPRCATIEIVYLDSNANSAAGAIGANTGTFSYSVDGGGSTTTTVDNVNPIGYKRITISGLSDTTHTLLLTGVSATCYLAGIWYYGASGVIVSRFGLGGATALDLSAEGVVTHLSAGAVQRVLGSLSPPAAPVIITGAVTNGSRVVTGISSTAGIVAGMPVGASAQIALPCFVESVDSSSQITLTTAATGDNAARTMYVGAGVTYTGDLWVIPIGHNDWQQQNSAWPTPVPVFKAQLQRVINMLVAAGGCVLLVGEPKSPNVSPIPETYRDSDYWQALTELASTNTHVACIQINSAWGTFAQAKALGLLSDAGGVHPLKKGSADMARLLFEVIVAPQVPAV